MSMIQGMQAQAAKLGRINRGYQEGLVIVERGEHHTIGSVRVIKGNAFQKAAAVIKCKLSRKKKYLIGKHAIVKNLAAYVQELGQAYLDLHKQYSELKYVDKKEINSLAESPSNFLLDEATKITQMLKKKDQGLLQPKVDVLRGAATEAKTLADAFQRLHRLKESCDPKDSTIVLKGQEPEYIREALELIHVLHGHRDYALWTQIEELNIFENLRASCLKEGDAPFIAHESPAIQRMVTHRKDVLDMQAAVTGFKKVKPTTYVTYLEKGIETFQGVSRLSGDPKLAYPTQVSALESGVADFPELAIKQIAAISIPLPRSEGMAELRGGFNRLRGVRDTLVAAKGQITDTKLESVSTALDEKIKELEDQLQLVERRLLEKIKGIYDAKLTEVNEKIVQSEQTLADLQSNKGKAAQMTQQTAEEGGDVFRKLASPEAGLFAQKLPKDLKGKDLKDVEVLMAILRNRREALTGNQTKLRKQLDKAIQSSNFPKIPSGTNEADYLFSQQGRVRALLQLATTQERKFEMLIHPLDKGKKQKEIVIQRALWGDLANSLQQIQDSRVAYFTPIESMLKTRDYSKDILEAEQKLSTLSKQQQETQATLSVINDHISTLESKFIQVDPKFIDRTSRVES